MNAMLADGLAKPIHRDALTKAKDADAAVSVTSAA
jgi:hypothetical protein